MAFGVCNKEDIVLNVQLDGAAKPIRVTLKTGVHAKGGNETASQSMISRLFRGLHYVSVYQVYL